MSESESKPKPNLDRSLDDLIKEGKPKQEKRKPGKKQGAHKGSGDGGNQGSGHRLVVVNNAGGINKVKVPISHCAANDGPGYASHVGPRGFSCGPVRER